MRGDPTALPELPTETTTPPFAKLFSIERWAAWGPLPPELSSMFDRAVARLQEVLGLVAERIDAPRLFGERANLDEDWFTLAGAEHATTSAASGSRRTAISCIRVREDSSRRG